MSRTVSSFFCALTSPFPRWDGVWCRPQPKVRGTGYGFPVWAVGGGGEIAHVAPGRAGGDHGAINVLAVGGHIGDGTAVAVVRDDVEGDGAGAEQASQHIARGHAIGLVEFGGVSFSEADALAGG